MKYIRIKNNTKKRVVAFLTSAALFASSLAFPEVVERFEKILSNITVSAAVDPGALTGEKTIRSMDELYIFSNEYSSNNYQRINIILAITGEAIELTPTRTIGGTTYTWNPIGTSNKPFGGKLTINGNDGVQNIGGTQPLFGYIMDSVEIVSSNTAVTQYVNLVRTDDSDTPLFANNVVHDTNNGSSPATWNIGIGAYDAQTSQTLGTGTYGGVIGNVGNGSDAAVANIDLTIYSSADVSTSNNAGLICGKVNKDSTANVTINEESIGIVSKITSTGNNAGYFAGEMASGSSLNIVTNNKVDISSDGRTIDAKIYGGGLVGKNDQGTVSIKTLSSSSDVIYETAGTIKGGTAAGGVFGYFKIKSGDNRFSPSYYKSGSSGCTLKGAIAGGLVGVLDGNSSNVTYSGTSSAHVVVKSTTSADSTTYGGIIGSYSNKALMNTLDIEYVDVNMGGSKATNYGGAVGKITMVSYVKIDNFTSNASSGADSSTYFGGVIGSSGSTGSLLDIGTIKVTVGNGTTSTFSGGGVVGQINSGVLRLSGVTDLSKAKCADASATNGQIVGERTNALVYALGSGNDADTSTYNNGWRLIRSDSDSQSDDIGTWGEVVRIANIETDIPAVEEDPEADPPVEEVPASPAIVSFDSTNHTVTVSAAITDMLDARDFTKTALNMQLNDGSDNGSLCFDINSKRDSLLSNKNLTLSNDIDLSNTGITGFMRDGSLSSSSDVSEVGAFSGKLSSSDTTNITVKLAVGERFGVLSDGTPVSDSNSTGRGAIFVHRFNGLFARTGDTATIENITIDGTMNIRSRVADMYVGGVAAFLRDSATLTSVNAKETINYFYANVAKTEGQYIGGVIGKAYGNKDPKVTIQGNSSSDKATISPKIIVTGTSLNNEDEKVNQCVGGVIGFINTVSGTVSDQTETEIKNIILSANIDASGASSANHISAAGLIADMVWDSSDEVVDSDRDTRKLILSDIDVKGTVIKNKASASTGGILGYRWFSTDVELRNVNLATDTKNNVINTTAQYIGGLVYTATGNWYVPYANGISINSLDIKNGESTATPSGLGIIVYNGYHSTSGLFLELCNKDSYSLAGSGLTIPDMTGSGKVYDELVACLSNSASNLLLNNTSGIISYKTNGVYSMTNSRNSYNNKYNTTVVNNRSRYYYNADRNMSSGDGYKLLKWSLKRYAATNLKRCFTNPFSNNVLSGTFDLNHVSYYPIDIEDDVSIGNATFVFYNANIEATETATDTKRSTRDGNSQHYLMHMGLFKDVSATITTTGNITMYGSVGVNETYSGSLINGKLTGSLDTATDKKITLGYYRYNEDDDETIKKPLEISDTSRYFLINSIGSNAVLNLNGLWICSSSVYTPNDSKSYASSLIGDVQGTGITLNFSNIKIDARNKTGVTITSQKYGTAKSIFSNATLLNKLAVDSTSVAIYNFGQDKDWKSSESHITQVTYGKELTSSVSYAGEENRYYENGENGNYIDPVTYPGAFVSGTIANDDENHPYDFSTDFLPYVRYYNSNVPGAPSTEAPYTLREIKVNVVPSDLSEGCGTYDHPYEISTTKQFNSLALMLENADSENHSNNITYVRLPLSTAAATSSHWCLAAENTNSCHLYKYNTSNDKYEYFANEGDTTPADTWNAEDVRSYLASAYYYIKNNISLDDNFNGLGGFDSRYAFKGVIVGNNANITITNSSGKPFIKISNGTVIKRLNIVVNNYVQSSESFKTVVASGSSSTAFSYSNNDLVYGGVIGKIMGGDNIIDQVSVSYTNNNQTPGFVQIADNSSNYLYCVGGYVGAIVNGGLIFRNMGTIGAFKVNTSRSAEANFAASTDNKHLYINPYIGRVINGYAIYETESYSGDSVAVTDESGNYDYKYYDNNGNELTGVTDPENDDRIKKTVQQFKYDSTVTTNYTLNNSTKNYQISNVKTTDINKISFGTYDSKNTIDIADGQSLFMLSLITQSGAGTAQTASGDYAYAVSYDGTDPYWANVNNTSTTCRIAAENVATHLATYENVGNVAFSDKTLATSDYYLSKSDTLNDKKAVPYIIYKYTQGSGTSYTARSITYPGNTFIMRLTTQNSNYNLPESFRGIGSICTLHGGRSDQSTRVNDEDGRYALELYGFEGNGATIAMDLKYNTYGNGYDNYIATVYGTSISGDANTSNYQKNDSNGIPNGIHVGFGLFNYVLQKKSSDDITYNTASGYYIGNFDLTGKVTVKEYDNTATEMDADSKNYGKSPNRGRSRYAVGGVISSVLANDYVNLYQLKLKNFNVSGTAMVGGYLGRCNLTGRDSKSGLGRMKVYINNCSTENLVLTSKGGFCGGITAGYAMGFLDIYVNTAPDAESTMNLSITNTTNCEQSGTGGVIGTCMTGLNDIWINNVTVIGMANKAYIKDTYTGDKDTQAVGGFIGYARKAGSIIITNSTVKNVDITGSNVGGIFGYIEKNDDNYAWGQSPYIRIYNCKIENDEVDSNGDSVVHVIEGQKNAGGITGFFGTKKGTGSNLKYDTTGNNSGDTYVHGYDESADTTNTKYKYDIEGCEVSGYTIAQKKSDDAEYGVGGFIGYAAGTTRTIMNSTVHDCTIKIEGSSEKHYMGGVVGYTGIAISGYNISAYNNTFTYQNYSSTTATVCGNLIGKTGNQAIKIAGFSRKNNYRQTSGTEKVIVASDAGTGTYGNGGYIIDADYTGVSIGDDHGKAMSSIMNSGVTNVGEGAGKNYYPYVTVSPWIKVGNTTVGETTTATILTGDGVNIVNGSPVAKLIVNERKSSAAAGNDRIKYSNITTGDGTASDTTDAKLVSDMIEWGEDTTSDHDIKLTTYGKEMGLPASYVNNGGQDFPIIAIGGGSNDYTAYIRAYINVLTNSSGTYNSDGLGKNQESNRYKITIYPCQCINGVYQRVSGTAGLKYAKSGTTYVYSMNDTYADSVQNNNQISMIDICYCDPTATSSTAYHLYVPVLTKKLLKFNFSSSALQGTEYEPSVYEAKFPENWGDKTKLGNSFDAWQTIFVKFEYTKSEMDAFLGTGKGLDWNDPKTLNFKYSSTKSLGTKTEFVLLDNNNNVDKEYYKTKSASDTKTDSLGMKSDVINFSDFTSYSPQKLKDIAGDKIIYEVDANGKYVECSEAQATVIAYAPAGGGKKFFKEGSSGTKYTLQLKYIYQADSEGTYIECNEDDAELYAYDTDGKTRKFFKTGSNGKYKISDDSISETYYLSMYTFEDDNERTQTTHDTYGFTVECPMSFTNSLITCQKSNSKNTDIFLGKFLKQSLSISDVNTNTKMSADNHVLNATLTSTVEFDGDSINYFYINLAGEKLYQGFNLYLNRYDIQGNIENDCSIKGTPNYSYLRTVNGTAYGSRTSGGIDDRAPYLYITPIEIVIPEYTASTTWRSVQTAEIEIDFSTNESKLAAEFPVRTKTMGDYRGIGLDATAKLDFDIDRVPYSNNSKVAEEIPNQRYYIDRMGQGGVLTLTAIDQPTNDEYDSYGEQSKNKSALGINGMYIDSGSKYSTMGDLEHIDLGLDYDVTNLPDEVFTDGGYSLEFTISLEQKNDSTAYPGYVYEPVNIEDLDGTTDTGYLDNFRLLDKNDEALTLSDHTDSGYLYYKYSMPLSTTQSNWTIAYSDTGGQKHFTSNIGFDVKTEDLLREINGYKYANYRLKITAKISKGSTSYTSEDYIVYTNARVNAEYVVAS